MVHYSFLLHLQIENTLSPENFERGAEIAMGNMTYDCG